METETALVGTDRAVELYTVSEVDLDVTFVIHPRYAESEDAVRLDDTLDDVCLLKLGMLVVDFFDRVEDLLCCLEELFLFSMLLTKLRHNISCFHNNRIKVFVLIDD